MSVSKIKLFLFGRPLRTEHAAHERLTVLLALPIFASDALSSVAYATEAILLQLADARLNRNLFGYSIPIGIGIVTLILMVVVSYWQIIRAYPAGGGAYIVAKENLGNNAGLIAASSLLVDYILTVAVSVAESVSASLSALQQFPSLHSFTFYMETHKVLICLLLIGLITLLNLRGVRESGVAFAVPSYLFIVSMLGLVAWGLIRTFLLGLPPVQTVHPPSMVPVEGVTGALGLFLVMRAFASGCSALTGIEAVSNGVQAFKEPAAENANKTLTLLGILLAIIFTGITLLANRYGVVPGEHLAAYGGTITHETVVSQVTRATLGVGIPYYIIQAATALILFLAANTAFAGFPRLASILAEDGCLPRQLASLGERLAFNNGIVVLALLAAVFITAFAGETHALLPLYTVGVFIAFTLSQGGMVMRWKRMGVHGINLIVNAIGCMVTATVLVVVLTGKFWVNTPEATLFLIGSFRVQEGAWIALLLMWFLVILFKGISRHYHSMDAQIAIIPPEYSKPFRHTVIVLVPSRIHRGVVQAINYARSISENAVAVHIAFDSSRKNSLQKAWKEHGGDTPLLILDSPYRTLIGPLMAYLDAAEQVRDDDIITVVLPEFVPAKWWHNILHNASGWLIRLRLYYRRDIVFISVRYYLDK